MVMLIYTMPCSPSEKEFMLQVYQNYERLMFSVARRYSSDILVCEDIVQDCLVKLMKKIDALRAMESCILAGYIVSTVRNTSINYLKKQGRILEHQYSIEDHIDSDIPSAGLELDDLLILHERKADFKKIWPLLSDEDKTLLEGKYILGYSDDELALQLGCKSDSIRMKLTRVRRKTLKLMMKQGGVHCDET